jgi:serine O-acetyltransferase
VLSPGAKILGDIVVGDNAKIGPNAVVRNDVSPGATVVGIPGREVHRTGPGEWRGGGAGPCAELDHGLSEDPEGVLLNCMLGRIQELEDQLRELQSRVPPPLSPEPLIEKTYAPGH